MKIVGIVGWKDSGKTTIATKIINKLSSKNFRVASIKHAHHEFDIDHENTDSFKHSLAGSSQVIVSSSKRWVKISELNNSKEKTLDELINQLSEVGAVMIVGGNIDHYTRVMTTAISLETRMGNLEYAMALGLVLISITCLLYTSDAADE